ncbi:MAG: mechanosensitive ion channel family protein [Desulfobacteraceae bacterium]|nr:mechanosensitive ion channel family protein [Desulfobacteraceae bacterium]
MNDSQDLFNKIRSLFDQAGANNETWQLLLSLAILVIGFILLEIVFRFLRRFIGAFFERKWHPPDLWNLTAALPPFRLAISALLLRLAESPLLLPSELVIFLHGVEALLLTLAGILITFQAINLLDRLPQAMPVHLRQQFTEPVLLKLKSVLRSLVLIIFAAAFIYTQRGLFPELIWKHTWWRYIVVVVIIYIVLFLLRLFDRFFSATLLDLKDAGRKERQRFVIRSTIWPARLLLVTIALYGIKEILPFPDAVDKIIAAIIGLLATLIVVAFVYRLVDVIVYELSIISQKEDNLMDQTFVQMIRFFARLLVVIVGFIYIIKVVSGKPMSALLAGLGIGGLAIALAAQDTLKNFFGSIMIMFDKPFDIGQRIVVEGCDGMIEDIGFRSTKLRTLTGHLVTIPNEKMAGSNIENVGRRPHIRRRTNITITYDTPPDKVERGLAIIRSILENHEGIHPDFPPRVYFDEFNDASLNIVMFYWYHPPDYWNFLALNERVNLQIMRAFEEEGIEFAFPTTTTYLAHDDRRPLHIQFSGDSEPVDQGSPGSGQPRKLEPEIEEADHIP